MDQVGEMGAVTLPQYSKQSARAVTTQAIELTALGCLLAPDFFAAGVDGAVPFDAWSLTIMYISPEASELTKSRPWLSKASPAGRKQWSGHLLLSALMNTSIVAVLLFAAATGSPLLKGIIPTL